MPERFTSNGKDYTLKKGETSHLKKSYVTITPCPNGKIRREIAANLGAKSFVYDDAGMTCWL